MSAVPFFRLKCDGDCGRWLSDVTMNGVAKLTKVRSRALVFMDAAEAMENSRTVGWTKCQCPDDVREFVADKPAHLHAATCEVGQGKSLCGNCRAKTEIGDRDHG
jgi:hypothetical protein